MGNKFVIGIVPALVLVVVSGCGEKEAQPPPKPQAVRVDESWPNIVLISIDTLRHDHLGCYGYDRKTSPNIDRLGGAGRGLREHGIQHVVDFTGPCSDVHWPG